MTTTTTIILLLSTLGCLGATAALFMLMRSIARKDALLIELEAKLTSAAIIPAEAGKNSTPFNENLRIAALTTRLQQPRLALQQNCPAKAPDRYTYIKSLVAKGMKAPEIASLLSMSIQETSQLITLIRMAQPDLQEDSTQEFTPDNTLPGVPAESCPYPCCTTQVDHDEHIPPSNPGDIQPLNCRKDSRPRPMKLARWIKNKASSFTPHNQSGREPPFTLHPNGERGRPLQPLPGYS